MYHDHISHNSDLSVPPKTHYIISTTSDYQSIYHDLISQNSNLSVPPLTLYNTSTTHHHLTAKTFRRYLLRIKWFNLRVIKQEPPVVVPGRSISDEAVIMSTLGCSSVNHDAN